ncbi:hypothetical protein JVT61DRAFT_3910 [Boletus reticuloceps]|uniref:Alpha-type protein kinase domain-containing protein n=1 Tax=Boletus reticuloceps TaxID=495285 RepID=A0A8I2YMA3_9AGAM|nr:hypothetical protein JVT61DRAFT_3910 [Boletus reticuloceps]
MLTEFTISRSRNPEVSATTADRALPTTPSSKKRGHQHLRSSDSIIINETWATPQAKKTAAAAGIVSPPRDAIHKALEKGETANVDVNQVINHVTETIAFHPVNLCPFDEILNDCMQSNAAENRAAWQLDPMGGLAGQIMVNKSPKGLVGAGTLKTAYNGKVVAKQPFFRSSSTTGKLNIIQRYTLLTNLSKLFREANILYWAKSLLDLTYMFVNAAIKSSAIPPPFNVPQLRFVDAGLALIHSSASKSVTDVYLVEEKILCGPNKFIKFIHNHDFDPSIESDEDGYNIAEFLVFTQHVQYLKTKGLAFISDYQGNSSLLTDP